MTTTEAVAIVRKACIAANPEIVELKFGCEVSVYIPQYGEANESSSAEFSPEMSFVGVVTNSEYLQGDTRFGDILVSDIKNGEWFDEEDGIEAKVIGRPIELADILLATEEKWRTMYGVPENPLGDVPLREGQMLYYIVSKWNLLKDNLSSQNDETLLFLAELLSVSK